MKAAWSALALAWPLFALDPLQSYTFTPDASEEANRVFIGCPAVQMSLEALDFQNGHLNDFVLDFQSVSTHRSTQLVLL